jgi:mRNA interferase MazF
VSSVVIYGVYTARFPFLETDKDKIRPVVVVSKSHGKHNIVSAVPVSAQADREDVDIEFQDWQNAGLVKPSVARVHRLTALLQSELTSQLGVLSAKDQTNLLEALKKLLIF